MSVSHKIIMNAACATASHFLLQPLSYPKYKCKSYHVSKVIALAKKAVRKQEWSVLTGPQAAWAWRWRRGCLHTASSQTNPCRDKKKQRPIKKNANLQQKGSNIIKEDLDLGAYRYFKETQSPISSGIWPVSLFSLRSLHEQIISTQIN